MELGVTFLYSKNVKIDRGFSIFSKIRPAGNSSEFDDTSAWHVLKSRTGIWINEVSTRTTQIIFTCQHLNPLESLDSHNDNRHRADTKTRHKHDLHGPQDAKLLDNQAKRKRLKSQFFLKRCEAKGRTSKTLGKTVCLIDH